MEISTGLCKSIQATCCRLKCGALQCCQLFKIQICGLWALVDIVQGALEFVTNSRKRGKLEGTSLPRGPLDTNMHESYLNIQFVPHSKHTPLSQTQPASSAKWNNRSMFWDQYKIHKFALFLTAAVDLNNASGNAVITIRQCLKAATLAMARWVILSLQPLLSQGPPLYWARRRATLARSYLLTNCHVLCSNVRQATRYCFVKDACLLPQNVAIKCKLVFFWRFSMPYSNACANSRLFVLLMDFLHSAGDLSVSARCSPLWVHKFLFVTSSRTYVSVL